MTAHVRKTPAAAGSVPKMELQRVRVGADGFDRNGAYWGAGPDVFIATLKNGNQEITVRAKSAAEAREKVVAELARAPGAVKVVPREPLGCASPNKSRYEIDWRDTDRITSRSKVWRPRRPPCRLPRQDTGRIFCQHWS